MIDNIAGKILRTERVLERKLPKENLKSETPTPLLVVPSFGSDESLVSVVRKYEPHLQRTRSFSESDCSPPIVPNSPSTSTSQPRSLLTPLSNTSHVTSQHRRRNYSESDCDKPPVTPHPSPSQSSTPDSRSALFKFVKKTGVDLRSRLQTSKVLALGRKHGKTKRCNGHGCDCCQLISDVDVLRINDKRVRSSPGSCKTYNIVYLVQCSICHKAYVGRTVSPLHIRLNGHRSKYYEVIEGRVNCIDITDDEHSLGIHLVDHGFCNRSDFNRVFKVCIIENCSPSQLELKENRYIHLLKTLRPHGLNTINPFGLRLIH